MALAIAAVSCDMSMFMCGVTGGWMRVANRQQSAVSQQRSDGNIHTCARNSNPADCSSVNLTLQLVEKKLIMAY